LQSFLECIEISVPIRDQDQIFEHRRTGTTAGLGGEFVDEFARLNVQNVKVFVVVSEVSEPVLNERGETHGAICLVRPLLRSRPGVEGIERSRAATPICNALVDHGRSRRGFHTDALPPFLARLCLDGVEVVLPVSEVDDTVVDQRQGSNVPGGFELPLQASQLAQRFRVVDAGVLRSSII
jgi:hypothetical protein